MCYLCNAYDIYLEELTPQSALTSIKAAQLLNPSLEMLISSELENPEVENPEIETLETKSLAAIPFASDQTLSLALQSVQDFLLEFSASSEYLSQIKLVYGERFSTQAALDLADAWQQKDFSIFPEIEFRTSSELDGANAAYGAETAKIYLSIEFFKLYQNHIPTLAAAILEEFGHHIDTVLNGNVDTAGDEGAIFSALVQGETLSDAELQKLKINNDQAVIALDSQLIQVEQNNSQISFAEVTEIAGVSLEQNSFGSAWGDFNGDDLPDLWVNHHLGRFENPRYLYLNQGDGTFINIAPEVLTDEEMAFGFDAHNASWTDFDNDGDQDLIQFYAGEGGGSNLPPQSNPNQFLINDGGVLRNQASPLGLAYDSAKANTPTWLDFDNDGRLDLFHGSAQRPDGLNPSTIFRQTDSGFEDVGSTLLPQEVRAESSRFGILLKLPDNGNLALLVPEVQTLLDTTSAPFGDIADTYFNVNDFNRTTDVSVADFNGDLLPDLYLPRGNFEDKLLLNNGQGWVDMSAQSGINNISNSSSRYAVAGDFDNDMDVDIYLARGTMNGLEGNLPNVLYDNQGNGTFLAALDAGGAAGDITAGNGQSVSVTDYDQDGFLDIFLAGGDGDGQFPDGRHQLFRNLGNDNNWLEINLEGVVSNRDAIGAQVFITAGGITQLREQLGGVQRRSQNYKHLHVGLGQNTQVDLIEIHWPSGTIQQIENVASNQILKILEGTTTPINTPPVAVDDLATTVRDVAVNIDVLANDSDADGDPLSLSIVTGPSNGTAQVNDNGTPTVLSDDFITYTPNPGFIGTDQVIYQIDDFIDTDIATATITVDDVMPADPTFLFSLQSSAVLDGINISSNDIVQYDGSNFSLLFQGSDVGLGDIGRITAFDVINNNEILISFSRPGTIGGLGTIDDSDVVKFTATSLGSDTAGTFELYLDGSDVDLTTSGENIDALTGLSDGTLLISTRGGSQISGARYQDEDLLQFTPASLGDDTNGTWALYFDGSDVGLADGGAEDIDAVGINEAGQLLFSTVGDFSVANLSGTDEDAFIFTASSVGSDTLGSFDSELSFDGSAFGLSANDISAADFSIG